MMYISSFLLVMSCKDWFLIWLGLEINMISFIMLIYIKYSMLNIESCMKYFFIQSLGSIILLMFIYMELNKFSYLSVFLLSYKIGGGPFYYWFPSICNNISWWSCFFLMTLQKIIPLMLISLFISKMVWIISMMSLLIGMMGSMNQVNMKNLMAFSSIHHIGWMMMSFMVSDNFWMMYLLIYMIMMLGWINFLEMNMVMNINDSIKFENKWIMFIILLNLGGIPPLMGFFLKMWSFYYFLMYDYVMMIMLLLMSITMLYIYFRILYNFMMGGLLMYVWSVKDIFNKWYEFDMSIMMSFCLSSIIIMLYM